MAVNITIKGAVEEEASLDILLDSIRSLVDQLKAADPEPIVVKTIDFTTIGMKALGTIERIEEDG